MRKNISFIIVFSTLFVLFFGSVAFATSSYAAVTISKNNYALTSHSVGVAKKAQFHGHNNKSSTSQLTMNAYACWTGWPYTCESSTPLSPSGDYTYTERQSRNSSYYLELVGYKRCNGSGYVSVD